MKMHYLKIFLGIFVVLSVTRFMPHPPNFTSLIALSFYVPVFLGIRFLPAVIFSFALSDIFIGYHHLLFLLGAAFYSNYRRENYFLVFFSASSSQTSSAVFSSMRIKNEYVYSTLLRGQ